MKILVSGSTGLIGSNLVACLTEGGNTVTRLVRRAPAASAEDVVLWDPYAETIDRDLLEGYDAVVHLSGENVAGRWTPSKKEKIRESRVRTTHFLSRTLAGLDGRPKALVCASAIGYYGERGEEELTEESGPGSGFLADVCAAWEGASESAAKEGIRVVHLRFGVVLSPDGGALNRMLPPFRLGLGGVVGSGGQYMSWIALDDVVGAIDHAIRTDSLKGPVNATAPNPVTNREFTEILGRVLSRPTFFPMPTFAVRLAFGEMGEALLLGSTRALPTRLTESGYRFRHSTLEPALRQLLSA
jgi:uncharacterized protein (TIGR01777 family)